MQVATHTQATGAPAERAAPLFAEVLEPISPRLFTVDEFHRMVEAGVFGDGECVELLEGVIVALTTQGPAQANAIRRLNKWMVLQLGNAYSLLPQLPVTLGQRSEPVPDLAVVATTEGSAQAHPRHALLVIEVSDTTLGKDRRVKLALYARYGVPEYWIVNVKNSTVEVHRDPDPEAGRYRTLLTAGPEATLSPLSVPGITISLHELFA